jgi:nitrite reductase/ring-hydroxylating ferredoxin subunit/uncharacterized membrane protein
VWLGHPMHSAITDVPVGAWSFGMVMDLLGEDRAADLALTVGVVSAVPAALSGMTDWSETEGRQRRLGMVHGLLNSAGLACYIGSLYARSRGNRPLGVGLSTAAYGGMLFSAWLGGELVYHDGTAVDRNAFTEIEPDFQVAARAADLQEGQLGAGEITVGGEKLPIVLLKRGERILALNGRCSHWGATLAEGELQQGDVVQCPWHGSRFAMEDGSVQGGPAQYAQTCFEARVRDGNVEVRPVMA